MTARVAVVIQARMGSTRLPGKVLAPIAGRPALALQLARLAPLATDHTLVVATSDLPEDDPVAELGANEGATVIRGPEADVLARYARAVEALAPDVVVRLTADCPLSDPAVVAAVIELHDREGAAYASNVHPRSFPRGLDVEVVVASALVEADREATEADEREHVTPFVHRRPDRYPAVSLSSGDHLGHLGWTVDTAEDLDRVRGVAAGVTDPVRAGWRELLAHAPPGAGGR